MPDMAGSPSRVLKAGATLSALAVILATLGCAPPHPKASPEQTEPMRHMLHMGAPVNADISYLMAGDPKGVRVVLVHGTPGSAQAWTDYLMAPPQGMEVVALDRPGFGRSGPDGAVTSLAAQAAAVAALLPTDGRQAVLLGHSMGGPIAAWVAAEHPQQVAGLVMLAASLDPGLEKIHPMQPVGTWWPFSALLSRPLRNANTELMALKPELERLAPLLAQVRAPVIIVHGTDDALVPVANVPYMQAHFTQARCQRSVLLQGQNHFLPWNSEPVVREAIHWAAGAAC